jgi:putative NADPH-quinone reductase
MGKRITIIQGHPDPRGKHFGEALSETYVQGAKEMGHEVQVIDVARLDFPLLRSKEDYDTGVPPDTIRQAQHDIKQADHLVIFYPLWLGTMPAVLKGFLEQVFRPGFAYSTEEGKGWRKLLSGKSARIVITMGMPAFIYRWYFRAYSLKSLERNILGFCGIGPIKESLIGMVEGKNPARRERWLDKMYELGRKGD